MWSGSLVALGGVMSPGARAAAPDVEGLARALDAEAAAGRFVGAVRVDVGEEVALARSFGPVPADPVCRVGSLTKCFTAAAIYALQDRGLLSVDDPVGRWLPEVEARVGEGPPLRALLTHRGGLSEPAANPWMRPPERWEDQARVLLPQLEREAAPGERERYSNFGFTLLAAVAARASGRSYEEVLSSELLDPLGLRDTGLVARAPAPARLIRGRLVTPVGLLDAQRALPRLLPYDYRWPDAGDGGLTSSPADLARWAAALRDGEILSDEARADLLRAAPDSDLAAGWVRDGARVWHNGALAPLGVYAYLRWSLEDDVVVALCGAPTVGDSAPEWGAFVEAALAGDAVPTITQRSSAVGWAAALSTLRVHQLLALFGLVLAAAAPARRAERLAAAALGTAFAALGLGLTHGALGAAGAVGAGALAVWRWRRSPPGPSGGVGWLLLLAALGVAGLCNLMFAGVIGLSWLVENIWSISP